MNRIRALAAIALALAGSTHASSREPAGRSPPTPAARGALFRALPALLQQGVKAGMERATFETRIAAMARHLDADGNGTLDIKDALAFDAARIAKLRAATVAALVAFDTDADGKVSEAELAAGVRRGLPLPPGQTAMDTPEETAKGVLWAYDGNRDGFVDYDEMRQAPLPAMPPNPVEAILALAPRDRESLTPVEAAQAAGVAVFDLLDANGDGLVDETEYAVGVIPAGR
jgi:Ca2+-binding EF-hand superfamily protein